MNITSALKEHRVLKPNPKFAKGAHISSFAHYEEMYDESIHAPEKFWAKMAEELSWYRKWTKVLRWKLPFASGSSVRRSTSPTIVLTGT